METMFAIHTYGSWFSYFILFEILLVFSLFVDFSHTHKKAPNYKLDHLYLFYALRFSCCCCCCFSLIELDLAFWLSDFRTRNVICQTYLYFFSSSKCIKNDTFLVRALLLLVFHAVFTFWLLGF